ncbi:type I methionyl aminopeptidase [bacterium]|nr:type I methionyl aminopeptidase [bacterium]|tara:strand:+ start:2214 stop:2984 length:771 start_codon:yes stop_codon:yes gene_type:complete
MSSIPIKTQQEIQIMRQGGKILAKVLGELKNFVKPGIMTKELDKLACDLVLKMGGFPSFKNYKAKQEKQPFLSGLCTCINEQIVHCAPGDRKLKNKDLISLDLGVLCKGFHTDAAITVPVGKVSNEACRLLRAGKKALKRALRKARPGNTIGDIGNTIERYVKSQGFYVIKELCGHGIGKDLHEPPQILNYGKRHKGEVLKPGMALAIEPMICIGDAKAVKTQDEFGYKTSDNSLAVHFEHTIVIRENKCQILTQI